MNNIVEPNFPNHFEHSKRWHEANEVISSLISQGIMGKHETGEVIPLFSWLTDKGELTDRCLPVVRE